MIMAESVELPSMISLGITVASAVFFVYFWNRDRLGFLLVPTFFVFLLALSVFLTCCMLPTVNTEDTKQAKHYATECVLLEMGIPTQFGRMNKLKCHEIIEHVGTDSYQWHMALYEKLKQKEKV
nr:hypothetical protein [Providencia rettgeri]